MQEEGATWIDSRNWCDFTGWGRARAVARMLQMSPNTEREYARASKNLR